MEVSTAADDVTRNRSDRQRLRGRGLRLTAAGTLALAGGLSANAAMAETRLVALEFQNCTADQAQQITDAFTLAAEAVDAVSTRLAAEKQHDDDLDAIARWTGQYTSRFQLVKELKHLARRLDHDQLPIVAECNPGDTDLFAWTYPSMTGEGYISFGWHFFNAPLVGGADSGMGTVVHELSHMVPGLATDDYFYKDDQILALARIFPEFALDNAQNIEYLVEEVFDRLNGTGLIKGLSVLRSSNDGEYHLEPFCRECR